MFVIRKMRLNKFQPRPKVSNRALFVARGQQPGTIESRSTADCFNEPSILGASKTKVLGLAEDIANTAYAKRESDGAAPSLPKENAVDK